MVNKDFYRSIENQFHFPVTSYLHLIDFLDLQGGTNYLFRLIIDLYCVKLAYIDTEYGNVHMSIIFPKSAKSD